MSGLEILVGIQKEENKREVGVIRFQMTVKFINTRLMLYQSVV